MDYSVPALGSAVDNLRVAAKAFLYNAKAGDGDGVNLFARLALEEQVLHRYTGQVFVALGDRSAVKTAARVEVGTQLRI